MSGPLAGIRVLDLSRLLPGPYAAQALRELGAEVDKVEDPHGGDYLRVMPYQRDGQNAVFRALNRGKRSAVLDLKHPAGRDAFLRLVPRYDVLIESFRPGVMARLGLGYDEVLSAQAPRIVYCALTGYGATGPLVARAGHDLNYIARAGVLGVTGPEDGPPQAPGTQTADLAGALVAVSQIVAALYARERTGRGAFVDVSLCESATSFAMFSVLGAQHGSTAPRGGDVLTGGIAPYSVYETADGQFVALGIVEPKFWETFCRAVGWEPTMDALVPGPHQHALRERARALFRTKTRDAWAAFAAENDCCLEPVLLPEELAQDPYLTARGLVVDGALRSPFGRTLPADEAAGGGPKQGKHTAQVLENAGFSPDEIDALRRSGAAR